MKASHFFWTSISNEGKPNLARHGKQKKPADFRSPLHASAPEAESGIDRAWPLKSQCAPNTKSNKINRTVYDEQYLRAYSRQHSEKGKRMKKLRQSTVEPVFVSLTQFYGLRKIGVLGKAGAHKVMLMAAIAFNLKKYLKKGGRKPSIGIFKTIMDAFQGYLTIFIRQIQSRPVLLKVP